MTTAQPQHPTGATDAPLELTHAMYERHLHAALRRIRDLADQLRAETLRADRAEEAHRALLHESLARTNVHCRTANRSRWSDR